MAATINKHRTLSVEKYRIPNTFEKKYQARGNDNIISSIPTEARSQDPSVKRKYKNTKIKLKIALNASETRISTMMSNINEPMK